MSRLFSPLEKISRELGCVFDKGRKYLLTMPFVLASCDSLPQNTANTPEYVPTPTTPIVQQGADVKEYRYSFGFFIPEGTNIESVNRTLRDKAEDIMLDAVLELAMPGLSIIREAFDLYAGTRPTFNFYVQTEESGGWRESIHVCPDDEVYIGLLSERSHAQEGITAAVFNGSLPVRGTHIDEIKILKDSEARSGFVPNFFYVIDPVRFGEYFSPNNIENLAGKTFSISTIDQSYGRSATVFVDIPRCNNFPPTENTEVMESPIFVQERETNDNIQSAQVVSLANAERMVIITGALFNNFNHDAESDRYKFQVSEGDRITVTIESDGELNNGSLLYLSPYRGCEYYSTDCVKGLYWNERLVGISTVSVHDGFYIVGVDSCRTFHNTEPWIDSLPARPQGPCTEEQVPYTLRISLN